MTPELVAAAVYLAETLAAENAALDAMDLPRAASMLEAKTRAMEGFGAARAAVGEGGSPVLREVVDQVGGRLSDLARENKRLLERAMSTQQRVMEVFARAVRQSAPSPTYGRPLGRTTGSQAYALSSRA